MTAKAQIGPLALLSAAALSLPAFSASQPTERVVSVNTSVYQEGDANAAEVVFGDLQRFRVKTNQFNLSAPIGRDWSMSLGYDNEAMSGASPWGTVAASDGSGDLIMSGASIDDSRNGVDVNSNATLARSVPWNLGRLFWRARLSFPFGGTELRAGFLQAKYNPCLVGQLCQR